MKERVPIVPLIAEEKHAHVDQVLAGDQMAAPSWKDFAPEPYTGRMSERHPTRLKNWKKSMETAVALAYPNANAQTKQTVLRQLLPLNTREPATTYVQEEIPEEKTWGEATTMLAARFEGEKEKLKSLETLLDGITQNQTEEIDAFYTRWKGVYELTGLQLDEGFKIVFFKRTLKDSVRLDIAGERPQTVDALLTIIRNRAIDGRYDKKSSKGRPDEKKLGEKSFAKPERKKFTGDCHWCGKPGHREAECRGKEKGLPKKVRKISGKGQSGKRVQMLEGLGQVFLDSGSDVSLIVKKRSRSLKTIWNLMSLRCTGAMYPFLGSTGSNCLTL